MLRRALLLLMAGMMLPAFASAATYWQILATTSPTALKSSLSPARPANFGNYTTPNVGTTTSVTKSTVSSVDYVVTVPSGYALTNVKVDGAVKGTTAGTYTVNKGTTLSHSIVASYTTANYIITTIPVANGSISPSITYSTSASITVTPFSGNQLTGVVIDNTTYTLAASLPAFVTRTGGSAGATYRFTTGSHTIRGLFAALPSATAFISTPNHTVAAGTAGIAIDGSASTSNVPGTTYGWTATCGTVTPTGPKTATYDAPATTGSCTVMLTVTAAGVNPNPTASVTFTTVSPVLQSTSSCLSCHNGTDGPGVPGFTSSVHYGVRSCADCHNPGGTASHAYILSVSNVSPTSFKVLANNQIPGLNAGDNFCSKCHSPAIITEFEASSHSVRAGAASCSFCHASVHNPNSACVNCHTQDNPYGLLWPPAGLDFHNDYTGSNLCANCHNLHNPGIVTGISGAAHYNNITSGVYPASYMTSRASCTNCHVSNPANATVRHQWAKSGHAAFTDPAWIAEDFKTMAGCVQCHTSTGFIAYSTGKTTAAWGVASDKTKEVLTCIGCHSDVANGIVRAATPVSPFANDSYVNRNVGPSNICMDCHSGRNNGLSIASADFGNQAFIAPHYLAAGGILHGKGGYNFPGQSYAFYSSNTHRAIGMGDNFITGTDGPCIGCHMSAPQKHRFKAVSSATNGAIAKITTSTCANCHGNSLDDTASINARQASFANALEVLKQTLAYRGFSYSPNYPYFSSTSWGSGQAGANTMGAAFNYVLLLKEPGAYAHNSAYAKQLTFDSIDYLYNGTITGSIDSAVDYLVGHGITQAQADSLIAYQNTSSCKSCHADTSGSHPTHLNSGFGCIDCHSATASSNTTLVPGTTTHLNGSVNLQAGPARSFTYSAGTCSSVSCHNNGTATWGTTLGCNGCHAYPPAYVNGSPKANSHANHSFGCDKCHAGTTADGTTITGKALHADGTYNVNAGNGASFTYTYASTGGSCSNISCHGNTNAVWGSSLGCGTCHGNPPPAAAGSYTGPDEAASPHMRHAGAGTNYSFDCSQCHKGNSHGTGSYQDVFLNTSGIIAGRAATYTAGTMTCSALYCHSSGTSRSSGQPAVGSITWGAATLNCSSCHAYPPAYVNGSPKANSHANHSFGCDKCHAGTTADGTTITGKALHADGTYNVNAGNGPSFTYTYASTGGSCSNISCHGNTSAVWGSSLGCGTCHGNPPPAAAGSYTGPDEAASPHMRHAGAGTNYSFDCSQCHKGNSHGTGSYQDVFLNTSGIIAGRAATYTAGTMTCSALYCHSSGTSRSSGQPAVGSITWGAATLNCSSCHAYPPAYVNGSPKANSHANHSFGCDKCHAGTTADGTTITGKALHADGTYNVNAGNGASFTYTYASTGGSCSNISCHGNTSAVWGSSLGCGTCHGYPPPAAAGSYTGPDEAASPHMRHAGAGTNYSFDCSQCHKGNSHGTGSYQDVFLNTSGIIAGRAATYTAGTMTCSALYCHSSGTSRSSGQPAVGSITWGAATLNCSSCHAYPPAYVNGSPKANSHANHSFGCDKCHAGTTADGTTITGKALHADGTYNVNAGNGASFTYTYASTGGSCSNISCHGNTNAVWGSSLGCGTCHGNPPPAAAGGYTGPDESASPHMRHAGAGTNYSFDCSQCHKGNSHGTGSYQDVFLNTSGIIAGRAATYTAGTMTCSALYCHSSGTSRSSGQPAVGSITWGAATLNCSSCHAYPPAYANGSPKANSHANHSFGCDKCHAGTTADGTTITGKALHADGTYNVNAGNGASFTYTYASTGGSCSNISCHGNTNAVWGSSLGCGTCHGNPPPAAAGSYTGPDEAASPHMRHAGAGTNYSFDCSQCHKGNSHGTGSYQDVFLNTSGIIAGRAATYTAGTMTCSALYCHSSGTSRSSGQPAVGSITWGAATLNCSSCHAYPPAYVNGSPKANSHANHSFGCDKCHAGTTADGTTITGKALHADGTYNVTPGNGASFTYTYAGTGGTCSNVSCHQGIVTSKWGKDHFANLSTGFIQVFTESTNHEHGQDSMNEHCALCHYANIAVQHNNDCSICHSGANPPVARVSKINGKWDQNCQSGACHPTFHTNINHDAVVDLTNCQNCHSVQDDPWNHEGTVTGDNCAWCHSPGQTLSIFIQQHPPAVGTPP